MNRPSSILRNAALPLLAALALPTWSAEDDSARPGPLEAAASQSPAPIRPDPGAGELTARELPERASRWSASAEVSGGSYRVSLSRGALDMGLGFDGTPRTVGAGRGVEPVTPIIPVVPSLSIGLRSFGNGPPAKSLIDRAGDAESSPASTRKVGLEWKPAQSRLLARGGPGLRLTGDDRVTMRLRKGTLGVYVKSTF